MLVYANYLPIRTTAGVRDPLAPVADWLSYRLRRPIGVDEVLSGGEFQNRYGWTACSLALTDRYPHVAAVELVHPDDEVRGRQWHSEITLQQPSVGADVAMTVLVQTSEISARVTASVTPGAPRVVRDVLTRCHVSSDAIGGTVRTLGDGDAGAFRHVLLEPHRSFPYVVVSPQADGTYPVDVPLLSQLLIGIAEPVVVPPDADTYWLARAIGEEYVPYRGAVKVVYPQRSSGRSDVRLITAETLAATGDPRAATREVFSLVLHRTNLPLSWKHWGMARVREERMRRELDRRRVQLVDSGDRDEYLRFLEGYVKDQDATLATAQEQRRQASEDHAAAEVASEQQRLELEAKVSALRFQLDQQRATADDSPYAGEDATAVALAVAKAIRGRPTPEECLQILVHLFPSRIIVLPDAWTSARESDGFLQGEKLFGLLYALATAYWTDLCAGKPDQVARQVFGSAYAAKESETVLGRKDARRRRTFAYGGQEYVMEQHLKIGRKDSIAETIRVHFAWVPSQERLVIAHCGPHIPLR